MNTPSWWNSKGVMAQCLRPLSLIWRATSKLRSMRTSPEKMAASVWCVGNATAGGGGKTPFCLYVGEQAKKQHINAYFIARGYGGSLAGPVRVDTHIHSAAQVGDEALLLASCLPTIVGRSRKEAANMAANMGAALIIMDDGMQYPHLHKDKTFLLLKGDQPCKNGYIMPAGPLRESLASACAKSDIIVQVDASTTVDLPITAYQLPIWNAATKLAIPTLPNKRVVGFAGIAHPEHFKRDLQKAGLDVVAFQAFADHYAYTSADIDKLISKANAAGASLITTQKDAVRIAPHQRPPIMVATQSLSLSHHNELAQMLIDVGTI